MSGLLKTIEAALNKLSHGSLAALLAIGLLGSFYKLNFRNATLNDDILELHVSLYDLESTDFQRAIYVTVLLVLAVRGLIGLTRGIAEPQTTWVENVLLGLGMMAAIGLGAYDWLNALGFAFSFVAAISLFYFKAPRRFVRTAIAMLPSGVYGRIAWVVVIGELILLWILPLGTPVQSSTAMEWRWMECHYAATVLPGLDAISGKSLGTMQRANYGIGMPLLVASFLKIVGCVYPAERCLFAAVKFFQLGSIVLVGIIFAIQNRKYASLLWLAAMSLTSFNLAGTGLAIGFPNQAGVRYIPLLLGMLAMAWELRTGRCRVWMLACVSALVTAVSPETGLALTGGSLTAGLLHNYVATDRLASLARSLAMFILIYVVCVISLQQGIVRWIVADAQKNGLEFLQIYGVRGYGGMVEKFSTNAAVFFLVGATVLLRGCAKAAGGTRLTDAELWQTSIASIMLVWIYYYVNRMAEWNLWFHWILLCMMIAPELGKSGILRLFPLRKKAHLSVLVICAAVGQVFYSSWLTVDNTRHWWAGISAKCGSCGCNHIVDRSNELQVCSLASHFRVLENFSRDEAIILSGFACYVYCLGFNEGFPWYDVPTELIYKSDLHKVSDWLDAHGPKFILAESGQSTTFQVAPEHVQQIQLHLSHLTQYRNVGEQAGWIVMQRFGTNSEENQEEAPPLEIATSERFGTEIRIQP